jgi:STE24 endopeptidase
MTTLIRFLTAICLASLLFDTARAQQTSNSQIDVPAAAVNVTDPAAATQAWLDTVPPNERAKSDAYFEGGYWLLLWNVLVGSAICVLLLATRISARLRDFAERVTEIKALQVVLYAVPFLLLVSLLGFPMNVYEHFIREHAYGMATQTFRPWFREQLTELAVDLIGGSIFLVVLYAVFRRAQRTWWIWATAVATMFILIGAFIAPIYIEPLFNKYTPVADPAIRDPILAMAQANEIPVKQVLEVDASRQTKRISANVAGFLNTTRIALNDNLLKQCTLPEIRYVMSHEMGHFVLNHVTKLTMYNALITLVGLALTRAVFEAAVGRWGTRWGVRSIGDPAGLPLLILIVGVFSFLITPLQNTITRVTEREADAFGINTCREPDGFAKVALKLGAYRKLSPSPAEEFIFFDHPSGRSRIRMAMDWKAAQLPAGGPASGQTAQPASAAP